MYPPKNRLARLAPSGYQMPPPDDYTPDMGAIQSGKANLSALSGSSDATGRDNNSPLLSLSSIDTPIMNQYRDFLTKGAPNPQDYAPSKTRRLLGAIAGFGAGLLPVGISGGQPIGARFDPAAANYATSQVEDEPLKKATTAYDTRAKALQAGANVEEKLVGNERGLAALQEREQSNQRLRDIQQQRADFARDKENTENQRKIAEDKQKSDKAVADAEAKAAEADRKAAQFQQKFQADQENRDNINKWHEAQLAAIQARAELTNAQHEAQLAETKRKTDAEIENQRGLRAAAEKRAAIAEKAEADKNKPITQTTNVGAKPPMTIMGYQIPFTGSEGKTTVKTTTKGSQPLRKEIPGNPGKFAVSTDGGQNWTAE